MWLILNELNITNDISDWDKSQIERNCHRDFFSVIDIGVWEVGILQVQCWGQGISLFLWKAGKTWVSIYRSSVHFALVVRLLISWLQSPSAVILEPPKIKSDTVSTVSPSFPMTLCLTLCDPIDGSHQAPPSLRFSRQEHWSGLPFPSPMHESEKWKRSHSVMSDS